MRIIKTPKQLSLFVAVVINLFYVILYMFYVTIGSTSLIFFFIIGFLLLAIANYYLLNYLIEYLILSKLRLLYRVVNQSGGNNFANKLVSDNILEEAEKRVMDWGKTKSEEIERLKEQELFRREFLGNLAHELKTPIFSIQGYILTLLEGGLEDEKINRVFLERANKGVDRIARVVEDLDLITEIESGRVILNQASIDIKVLVNDVLDSFEIKAKRLGIEFKVTSDLDQTSVWCDKDKMTQVLANLINNSINYGRENGLTEVRLYDAEDYILVEVADDGIGIDTEHQQRLFERFYRIDKSRARHEGGSGLGLSIVKHIVEAHNQSISVRSKIGEGSVFYFYLKKG